MARILKCFVLVSYMLSTSAKHITSKYNYEEYGNIDYRSKLLRGNHNDYYDETVKSLLPRRSLSTLRIQEQENIIIISQSSINLTQITNGFYTIFDVSSKIETGGRIETSQSDIALPGPMSRSSQYFEPNIPLECRTKDYCESILNYPVEHVTKLLEELEEAVNSFQLDELDVSDTSDRKNGEHLKKNLIEFCVSHRTIIYPEALRSADGKWYTVVNRKNNPVQGYLADICDDLNSKCSNKNLIKGIQFGYTVKCHQNFIVRKFAVLDHLEMLFKSFKLPSCCTCTYSVVK